MLPEHKHTHTQGLCCPAIPLYEKTVRFHILFGYLLAQQAAPVYDEHLG